MSLQDRNGVALDSSFDDNVEVRMECCRATCWRMEDGVGGSSGEVLEGAAALHRAVVDIDQLLEYL